MVGSWLYCFQGKEFRTIKVVPYSGKFSRVLISLFSQIGAKPQNLLPQKNFTNALAERGAEGIQTNTGSHMPNLTGV